MSSAVWFITGASRGIGRAIAEAALVAGERVALSARNREDLMEIVAPYGEAALPLSLDVTDNRAIERAVERAIDHFGRIDRLVNNAGYGQMGIFENVSPAQIEAQFRTNLFGAMEVTRAILPQMRQQKSGHIFTITSISGLIGDPGASIYCASKFALEGWMEALQAEVDFFGIKVTSVEPGFFRTDFLDTERSLSYGEYDLAAYASWTKRNKEVLAGFNHTQSGSPKRLAAAIYQLSLENDPPLHFAAGEDAYLRLKQKATELIEEADRWRELSCDLVCED